MLWVVLLETNQTASLGGTRRHTSSENWVLGYASSIFTIRNNPRTVVTGTIRSLKVHEKKKQTNEQALDLPNSFQQHVFDFTLSETNMSPENQWLVQMYSLLK